jgi:hypothetical protein
MIDVNVAQLVVLSVTAFGGVAIGFAMAPLRPGSNARSYCVVRRYRNPDGVEILAEFRRRQSADKYHARYREEYLKQGITIAVTKRADVDAFNASSMGTPEFWNAVQMLGDAFTELRNIKTAPPQAVTERLPVPARNTDAAIAALARKMDAMADQMERTGEIVMGLQRRVDTPPSLPELGSVMPQMEPTEAMPLPAVIPDLFRSGWTPPVEEPSHEQFVPDPKPTSARGVPVKPKKTTTVVVPMGVSKPPKGETDGPTQ